MKTLRLFLTSFTLILFTTASLFAQNKEFIWAHKFGSPNRDSGQGITTDANGNVYTVGYFERTVDFDPGLDALSLISAGFFDIFIQKLDPNGNLIWVKQIGSDMRDEANAITLDASGNIYITGTFSNTVDFDTGSETYNLTGPFVGNPFILKLDADGNFIWAKNLSGTNGGEGRSITLDLNGNIYTTGYFQGTFDFDPGNEEFNLTATGLDAYIHKMDANGNLIWVKQISGSGAPNRRHVLPNAIDTDGNGNVYTTGYFYEIADFNPGTETYNLTSSGATDIFIQKLDTEGNFLWAKQMGATASDQGTSLTINQDGDIFTTGYFAGKVDFGPGAGTTSLTAIGSQDAYILKLDDSGKLIWVKQVGGTKFTQGNSITTDPNGNVYTLGNFMGTVDIDPGEGITDFESLSLDGFILKLDTNGNYIWATQNRSNSHIDHRGNSIAVDKDDNVYSTGHFIATVDFDPGDEEFLLTSASGYLEIYIQKLGAKALGLLESSLTNKFVVHPNPTKGKFSVVFKSFQKSISVRMFSITGQLLLDRHFQNTKNLELEIGQSAGIYLLEIKDDQNQKATVRIVKQ